LWLWVALLVAGLGLTGCGGIMSAEEKVSQSFDGLASPRLIVETFDGSIDVSTGADGQITVEATKRSRGNSQAVATADLKNIEVTMKREGNTVRILARRSDNLEDNNSSVAIKLTVPAKSRLDLKTSNAGVTTNGISGSMEIVSSNGSLQVNDGQGKMNLKTDNGEIQIEAKDAVVNASTSNGNITFKGTLANSNQSFDTSNGSIEITLPAETHFRIEAETSNGKVSSEFSVTETGSSEDVLNGIVGEDPAISITATSSNGNIALHRGL
jgi:DUF4097 and DUF4098 domain-containing protein YvlB